MTGKIFLKLIAGVFCLLLVALVVVDTFATSVAKDAYLQDLKRQLADECRLAALVHPDPAAMGAAEVRRLAAAVGGRITIVRSDGKVLVDSEADAARMENHRTRKELIEAFRGQAGSDRRRSATVGTEFLYVAVPMPGGAVRIAMPTARIDRQVSEIRAKILAGTALAFLPAIAIAAWLARLISRRFAAVMAHAGELARGNFRARLPHPGASEFGQLATTLNQTAEAL